MSMTDSDKRMVVTQVVDRIFLPEVLVVVQGFIAKLKEQVIYQHEYKKDFGFNIGLPPVILDIRAAEEHLIECLIVALKDETEPQQPCSKES